MNDTEKEAQFQRWWITARDHYTETRFASALACLDQYALVEPDSKALHLLRGAALVGLARFEEAEPHITRGLPKARRWARAWGLGLIAEIRERQGKIDEAIAAYREAAEIEPLMTTGSIFLGACLARHGRLADAEVIHRRATELEGDPDEAFYNLGLVLRAQARLEQAARAFERAIEIDPEYEIAKQALDDVRTAMQIAGVSFDPSS